MEQYRAQTPAGLAGRKQVLYHLGYLAEYTRRLSIIECKRSSQPVLAPSKLRGGDLFVCVEVCAEVIRENTQLYCDPEFWQCWTAFDDLLEHTKSKISAEDRLESAYFLLYLAALIFKRHIAEEKAENEPEIFSVEGYSEIANRFPRPLFTSNISMADQLENLKINLEHFSRA